jgi:HEAT repeat protein
MFGVAISTAPGHSAAEKPGMSQKKKRTILAGGLLATTAVVLWLQYRPTNDLDPEAAANPAVREVVEMAKKNDTDGLARMAKSSDSAVARRAVSSLGSAGRFDALRDSLNDRRTDVRYAAVSSLGGSGDVQAIAPYTKDPDMDVRIAAMRGIANTRDFSMFDHLVPMLSDPQPSVRRAALLAIQDRVGLQFPDYDPEGSDTSRAKALARIRAMVPKMKQVFDRANEYELRRQKMEKR